MRLVSIILTLFVFSACSRNDPKAIAGTWENEIQGAKFSVQIITNWDGKYDLLTATVNGNHVYYRGHYSGVTFIGTDEDLNKPRPEEESRPLYTLAKNNHDGDLVCTLLNASQIPHGTILKKVK